MVQLRAADAAGLRGRVVLIDFWTYTCINCIRTQPHLKAWDARYRDDGLTIIGVHSPGVRLREGRGQRRAGGARGRAASTRSSRTTTSTVWNAFQNQYWPAKYLIDARGHLRYAHFGEGDYDKTEAAIRALLREAGRPARPRGRRRGAGADAVGGRLDAGDLPRARRGRRASSRTRSGRCAGLRRAPGGGAAAGPLRVRRRVARSAARRRRRATGARIAVRFGARRVFLVLGSPGRPRQVRGAPGGRAAADDHASTSRTSTRSSTSRDVQSRYLELRLDPGVQAYAFTFG